MHRRLALLACLALVAAGAGPAADPTPQEELRFVRELRERGDADLALEFLQRLAKGAPPELARELPLEIARTRLKAAADEPDSARRLAQYAQAQADFEKYLGDSQGGSRASDVRLDLADVAVLRGRTQLSRALLQETSAARDAEGARARELLVQAGEQLKLAAADLDRRVAAAPDGTPQERFARRRLEQERLRVELTVGLNLFDQAQTISKTHRDNKVLLERAARISAAKKVLDRLADRDNGPIGWQARAWAGRCDDELGEPKKARARFTEIFSAPATVAAEGQRLARYFRMLTIKDSPEPGEKPLELITDAANRWLAEYPRHQKGPEGCGVRYLLAEVCVDRARASKTQRDREADLERARNLLGPLEQSENDFTDRARRLKIVIIGEQGGFTRPVAELKTFDDCYVRAQYEALQMGEDARKAKDAAELAKSRKERLAAVLGALDRALSMPEAKKPSQQTNGARALYAYYALADGRYQDAARVGEEFARADPRSAQAAMAATYALEALGHDVLRREREAAMPEEIKADRDRLLGLAAYVEERWPREPAGDVARYQAALLLMRSKEPPYPEIVRRLEAVSPSFPGYARAQWELAQAALQAERDKAPPVPGDKPTGYHDRAMAALARIPQPTASDPQAAHLWLLARARLTREMYRDKKFDAMRQAAETLLARVKNVRADADDKRDQAIRNQIAQEAEELLLYARYGLAEADYAAGRYDKVAAQLDPTVKEFNEGRLAPMRRNPQLGMVLLGMDLKANVQLGRMDPARAVLKALQAYTAEGGAQAGASAILGQLAVLIGQQVEDLRKKGNPENFDKAVANFTQLLGDIVKSTPDPSPRFVAQLARCYSTMGQHQKAAELLQGVPSAKTGGDVTLYRGIRLMLVRELRQARDIKKAQEVLAEIMGTRDKPAWGSRDVNALKEKMLLLEEDGDYVGAARLATTLVDYLKKKVDTDNAMKEPYLECYFHMTYSMYKHGQAAGDAAEKEKMLKKAAGQIVELERKWEGFGSDTSRRRFEELLGKESPLKERYEQLKAGK
jgi:hypothetical protein